MTRGLYIPHKQRWSSVQSLGILFSTKVIVLGNYYAGPNGSLMSFRTIIVFTIVFSDFALGL